MELTKDLHEKYISCTIDSRYIEGIIYIYCSHAYIFTNTIDWDILPKSSEYDTHNKKYYKRIGDVGSFNNNMKNIQLIEQSNYELWD